MWHMTRGYHPSTPSTWVPELGPHLTQHPAARHGSVRTNGFVGVNAGAVAGADQGAEIYGDLEVSMVMVVPKP